MAYKTIAEIMAQNEEDIKNGIFITSPKRKHKHIYDTNYNNKVYTCSCGKTKKMIL